MSMEMDIGSLLQSISMSETEGIKQKAIDCIIKNEDVKLHWSILAANWGDNESNALLHMLVNHWVTIRGFSFTGSFMEKYKQKHKRTVEKSKGIRKNLLQT